MKSAPRTKLYEVAGAYEVMQVAIEAVVTTPGVNQGVKSKLQTLDEQAMGAIKAGRFALQEGREDDVTYYTALLRSILLQTRALIAEGQAQGAVVEVPR